MKPWFVVRRLACPSWPGHCLGRLPVEAGGLAPEEALKHFRVPPGLEVTLVASEPMIRQPVAIRSTPRPDVGPAIPPVSQSRPA